MNGIQLLPFSYTRLTDWERCPLYAYTVHVLKKRGPPPPAMARGTLIHEQAQQLVSAKRPPKHTPETIRYEREFKEARAAKTTFTEQKFAVTSAWRETEFFASNVWCRGVYDLVIIEPEILRVIDHKTGKQYDSHVDQLKLYAITGMVRWPEPKRVRAEAWYLDFPPDRVLTMEVERRDAPKIRKEFEARVLRMTKDSKMQPKPNAYCFNCHLNRRNGGTCDAGK